MSKYGEVCILVKSVWYAYGMCDMCGKIVWFVSGVDAKWVHKQNQAYTNMYHNQATTSKSHKFTRKQNQKVSMFLVFSKVRDKKMKLILGMQKRCLTTPKTPTPLVKNEFDTLITLGSQKWLPGNGAIDLTFRRRPWGLNTKFVPRDVASGTTLGSFSTGVLTNLD